MVKISIHFFKRNTTLIISVACILMSINVGLAQGFIIDQFASSISVDKSGFINVKEEIAVNFNEEKHGIFRDIPYVFKYQGRNYSTTIDQIKVANDNFVVSKNNGVHQIRIGDANKVVTGKKLYIITYRVKGPFICSDEYCEFYWNVTGNEWPSIISAVNFEVVLPDGLQVRYNDMRVFTGKEGGDGKDASIGQIGNRISGNASKILAPKEGLTIAIKLPNGYISEVNALSTSDGEESVNTRRLPSNFWYIPLLMISSFLIFWRKIKGEKDDRKVMHQYYPPNQFSAAEVGAYYDNVVHDRDVVSLLPMWADMTYLRMVNNTDVLYFEKLKDIDLDRPAYEQVFFNDLFKTSSLVRPEDLKNKFYDSFYKIKNGIAKDLYKQGLYDEDYLYWFKSWRGYLIGTLMILAGIGFILSTIVVTGGAFIVGGFMIIILCTLHPPASQHGKDIRLHLRGLYQFLKEMPQEQVSQLIKNDERYFEKMLPYAVAFGLDKRFVEQFKSYRDFGPDYYHTNTGAALIPATLGHFADSFSPKEIASAFSSMPPSTSSDGGSFSGGSSGGGFGGGGGGSW